MKLAQHIEAILAAWDTDLAVRAWFDPVIFTFELGMQDCGAYCEANDLISMKYIQTWACTDTPVGTAVYFIDKEPVAYSCQTARKNNVDVHFLSDVARTKVRQIFINLADEEGATYIDASTYEVPTF